VAACTVDGSTTSTRHSTCTLAASLLAKLLLLLAATASRCYCSSSSSSSSSSSISSSSSTYHCSQLQHTNFVYNVTITPRCSPCRYSFNPAVYRMITFFIVFSLIIHFQACAYWYVSRRESFATSWTPQEIRDADFATKYVKVSAKGKKIKKTKKQRPVASLSLSCAVEMARHFANLSITWFNHLRSCSSVHAVRSARRCCCCLRGLQLLQLLLVFVLLLYGC
jgi:hypothetical protein